MTKYIIKYQNGNVIILSGEEENTEKHNYTKESEKPTHKNTEYSINVSTKKKHHKTPDQSLLDVFTSSIGNLTKIIFGPFASSNEEEEEE